MNARAIHSGFKLRFAEVSIVVGSSFDQSLQYAGFMHIGYPGSEYVKRIYGLFRLSGIRIRM